MTRLCFVGLLLAAAVAACGDDGVGPGETGTVSVVLNLDPPRHVGFDIDRVVIRFEHSASDEVVTRDLDVSGSSVSTEVSLRSGRWDVAIELYDGDALAGSGTGTVVVVPGFVTEVNVAIELATGGVRITVEWAEGFHGVIADLSHQPVEVWIGGVGTYRVHGLSRIGWDIEVIEVPTQEGRTHKESGLLSYADVVMLGLTGAQSDAQALVAWIDGPPDPRPIEIWLQGLGGERVRIALLDVVVKDGEPEVTQDGTAFTVGGVLLGDIARIELFDYEVLTAYPVACPAPGQQVEIEGVTVDVCYPEDVLQVPAVDSSDPLYLPAVRDGFGLYTFASQAREDVETAGCVGCGNFGRRSGSVIDRDGAGLELGRVNLFEMWPSSFTMFHPEFRYGHSRLFHITLVTDWVQGG
jgi:hypothetical protein